MNKAVLIFYMLTGLMSLLSFAEETSIYTVQKGDTLTKIAKKFNLSSRTLQTYNALQDANRISVGQTLKIPTPASAPHHSPPLGSTSDQTTPKSAATYQIKKGDTLYRIAESQGVKLADLMAANPTLKPSRIYPGQTLQLPQAAQTFQSESSSPSLPRQAILVEEPTSPPTSGTSPDRPAPSPPTPATSSPQYKLVVITKEVPFSDFAKAHGMSVDQLNTLNGWDYPASTLLATGSEAYVVHTP